MQRQINVESQLTDAIRAAGLNPPPSIYGDGQLHRFGTNGKPRDLSGWYVLYTDGIPAGAFGDWRIGVSETWRADIGRALTPAEEAAHRAKVDAIRREREAEEKRVHKDAAFDAITIWNKSTPAPENHSYLQHKRVKVYGVRVYDGALVIPIEDSGGNLCSLQFINTDGKKKFLYGGRVGGCFFVIGDQTDTPLCIAEGFATGASIHEATGYSVVVAFNAGNLEPVAKTTREKFPDRELIMCADDDAATEGNPGLSKAKAAALAIGGKLAIPDFGSERPDDATDFNDLMLLRGAEVVKRQIEKSIGPEIDSDTTDDKSGEASSGEKKQRESQADLLVKIAEDSNAQFFHTSTDEPFIEFPLNDHEENWPIRSRATRRWLTNRFYRKTGKAPSNEAMQSALNVLEAKAVCEGDEQNIYLRAAWHDGALYYDLADKEWRVVRIDADGWTIADKPPVKFRRYSNNLPQEEPQNGGEFGAIWNFLNVKNDEDRRLIEAWLVTAFIPEIPRPMLVTHGDQGATKSTTCKLLLALVDPSATPCLRTKDASELVQALAHRFAAVLDNVSSLPGWLSDLLCCAITGDGFTKRQLFTDDDDVIYTYQRALLFNGINIAISKPDLLDRSLLIQLERPTDNERRKEKQLWRDFYSARPAILGAIFGRLSDAIRNYDSIQTSHLPRMADFAQWAMAATGDSAQFLADYKVNVERQNSEAVSESTVATTLLDWLKSKDGWEGQAHELHATLKNHLASVQIAEKLFPATPAALSKKLREIRPNLLALGWKITFNDKERPRKIYIEAKETPES